MVSMDRSRYPSNWHEISRRIRFERARGCCEWCGAPNNFIIQRKKSDPAQWRLNAGAHIEWFNPIKVFLTVHHIGIDKPDGTPGSPHDKMDCRDENLVALCQRCHLLADLKGHIENAKRTRQRKAEEARRAAGQLEMF